MLKETFHINDDKEYEGQKCYQLLHGKQSPCSFCQNHELSFDKFYTWYHFNDYLGRYFKIRDKWIQTEEGRKLRMEIAVDVTEEEDAKRELGLKVESEETLVRCIHTLSEISDQKKAINQLLAVIGEFYAGNRAYIFEFDLENNTFSNTYEWCKEGVTAEIDHLQDLEMYLIDNWMKEFEAKGCFYLSSVGRNLDKNGMEYQILSAQNIESLIAAPLIENDRIVGFIGVDDPAKNTFHLDLLTSVTYFVLNDIQKRKMMSELARLSFVDLLTGMFNRNKYIHDLQTLESETIQKIGIIYLDINGLKKVNDEQGHQAGDEIIMYIAKSLREIFPRQAYRIGGDEFIVICPDVEKDFFDTKVQQLEERLGEESQAKASAGAVWSEECLDIRKIIEKADEQMYMNKKKYYNKKK